MPCLASHNALLRLPPSRSSRIRFPIGTGFEGIEAAGFEHETIVTGGGAASMEILALHWVNIILGNLKSSIHGTYHALNGEHLPRYLAEFNYRFNRRFKLDQLVDRLLSDAARTPPMPARLIKLAEVAW